MKKYIETSGILLTVYIINVTICMKMQTLYFKEDNKMGDQKFYFKGVNGQISVYEDRIVIERRGFSGFMSSGLAGEKTIPMESIVSVQFKEGSMLLNGFIQFGVLGGNEATKGLSKAVQDENTVILKKSSNNEVRQIKEYIEEIVLNRSKNSGVVLQQNSPAEELKKFKELLDMNVISQEEFDAKKSQILGL